MAASSLNLQPVIVVMAGGSGTRFWPMSQKNRPKQFLSLLDNKSLLQQTIDRVLSLTAPEKIFVCSLESHKPLLDQQLSKIPNVLLEPEGKNTAPCLMYSVVELLRRGISLDTPMIALPADHYVGNVEEFSSLLMTAVKFASKSNGLITFGIVPSSAHSGYGYIEAAERVEEEKISVMRVKRFIEKPNPELAGELIQLQHCYWNSGIFVWTLRAISEAFEKWMPSKWNHMRECQSPEELREIYRSFSSIPIDVAILEKATNVYVIPSDIEWSDLGSWNALYELEVKNGSNNAVLSGDVISKEAHGCLVSVTPGKQVALIGIDDLIIVERDNAILIAHRSQDQQVRDISKHFET